MKINRGVKEGRFVEDVSEGANEFLSDTRYAVFREHHPNLELPSSRRQLEQEREKLEASGNHERDVLPAYRVLGSGDLPNSTQPLVAHSPTGVAS